MSRRKHEAHDDILDAMLWGDLPAFQSNRKISRSLSASVIGAWLLTGWGLSFFLLWLKLHTLGIAVLAAWITTIIVLSRWHRIPRISFSSRNPKDSRMHATMYMVAPGIGIQTGGIRRIPRDSRMYVDCPPGLAIQMGAGAPMSLVLVPLRFLPVNPNPRYTCSSCGLRFDLAVLPKKCPSCGMPYDQNASDVSNVKEE